jgi:hypothetical protein
LAPPEQCCGRDDRENASITEWVREDAVWHLERFNDTSHL